MACVGTSQSPAPPRHDAATNNSCETGSSPNWDRSRHAKSGPVTSDCCSSMLATQMAPASVTQLRAVLSSMMASALEAELIDANPVAGVRRPKVDRPDLAVPTADDLGRLMTAANNTTWAVPVLVSCTTGLRRGEVLGLRWKDIDLENGRLRVAKALQSVRDPEGTTALRLVTQRLTAHGAPWHCQRSQSNGYD